MPGAPQQEALVYGPPCPTHVAVGTGPHPKDTHLQEHFGANATLHREHAPTAAPCYLLPWVELGIRHDLLPIATIRGAIAATDACTTPAEMPMALAYEHHAGHFSTKVASGVGTSRRGKVMTLLMCAHQLAQQEGM